MVSYLASDFGVIVIKQVGIRASVLLSYCRVGTQELHVGKHLIAYLAVNVG